MGSPSQRVVTMRFTLLIICYLATSVLSSNVTDIREKRQFSLFSIVSFSNLECNSSTTSTTSGTCYTSSECASRSGNAEGNCAAGFGVCLYIEFGTQSTDTITLTNTWASLTAKNYNILARQIPCTAEYRAPTDCVQYFTGTAGSVQSYNFQGGKYLQNQIYTNCIRTEQGYCKIQWKESSSTTPDPFTIGGNAAIEATGCTELISIPNLSPDGVSAITIPTGAGVVPFQP